jgi:DNA-binding transcriptional LysR family regulator
MVIGLEEFLKDDNLYYKRVYQGHLCAVCSNLHPFATKKCIDMELLKDQPLIILGEDICGNYYHYLEDGFKEKGITPNVLKRAETLMDLELSASLNEGIGILPREVCIETKGIKLVPITGMKQRTYFGIAYIDPIFENVANAFVDYFKHYNLSL